MSATTTIRVPTTTHERLQTIANQESRSIGRLIEAMLDDYEEREFFTRLGEDFARLQSDPEAWADYQAEMRLWDATLMDGLDDEPDAP